MLHEVCIDFIAEKEVMWYEMSLLFVMSNSSKIVFTRRTPERKKNDI